MSQMQLVNLRVSKGLKNNVKNKAAKNHLSEGEFIRSSIIRMLLTFKILPETALLDSIRSKTRTNMKSRKEVFNKSKEIEALKKVRKKVYNERYKSGS